MALEREQVVCPGCGRLRGTEKEGASSWNLKRPRRIGGRLFTSLQKGIESRSYLDFSLVKTWSKSPVSQAWISELQSWEQTGCIKLRVRGDFLPNSRQLIYLLLCTKLFDLQVCLSALRSSPALSHCSNFSFTIYVTQNTYFTLIKCNLRICSKILLEFKRQCQGLFISENVIRVKEYLFYC